MSMKRICTLVIMLVAVLAFSFNAKSQGVPAKAFKNVTIHKADGSTIENGVIVWRDGLIEAMGADQEIPFDAEVWDGGDSLHVYPGFIDGSAYWGSPDIKRFEDTPQRRGEPSYERAGIRPERKAREIVDMDSDNLKTALEAGITTAALGINGYMIPGQLDLFFLHPELEIADLYEGGVGMQMQFRPSFRVYPGTVMGIMAQLNQLIADAQALSQHQQYFSSNSNAIAPPQSNPALEALYPVMENEQRVFFQVDSKEMIERVFSLQDENGFDVVIVSGMEAYKVADELNERDIPVLASVNFPEKPDWVDDNGDDEEAEEQEDVSEQEEAFRKKRWAEYQKRYKNIKTLMDAGVEVGFATAGLELKDLSSRLEDWQEYGDVDTGEMLEIMTENTASILNKEGTLGEIDKGRIASFTIMTEPFMEEDGKVIYAVSEGELTEF